MSSPSKKNEEPSSSTAMALDDEDDGGSESASPKAPQQPPAKRRLSTTAVIEISDTESDDSDICAVNSYQASADEVKRIRGADYSSSSSSSDYSSDSESPWEDDSIVVECDKVDIKVPKAQLNPRANRMDDPMISSTLKTQEAIDRLKEHWSEVKDYKEDQVTLISEPFKVCLLHDFLENPEIINNIVDDMNTLDWSRKKMDLFEFHQTADLANLTWQRSIRGIYELLKTEVMTWVSQVTGLELNTVSASCSLYGPGDHLLVHDDLLADRRVAFILYLAPWTPRVPRVTAFTGCENGTGDHVSKKEDDKSVGWCAAMGGGLELLARDRHGPTDVVRRVYPRNNMLAFFQVGTDSYHQVGEVLSLELPRLSINGWFHGPGAPPPPAPPPPPPPAAAPPHARIVLLNEWIEPTYMSPRSRAQIQTQMEQDSEVCLRDLLLPRKYQELVAALEGADIEWEWAGPSHQRRYQRVSSAWIAAVPPPEPPAPSEAPSEAPGEAPSDPPSEHPVRGVLSLLGSAAFVRLLADCCDLPLQQLRRLELQRHPPAAFTLLPPREQYQEARLEAVLYLSVPPRRLGGASTVYVAPEDPSPPAPAAPGPLGGAPAPAPDTGALVTVPPTNNALSLVYCDAGAASFTKYLSRLAMRDHPCIYMLTCTYLE